jgi:hypothetical protein
LKFAFLVLLSHPSMQAINWCRGVFFARSWAQ